MAEDKVTLEQQGPGLTEKAETAWVTDSQWDGLRDSLPYGAVNRLKRADRAIHAAGRIVEMLFADSIGRSNADATEGVSHDGIALIDTDALHIAVIELGGIAERMLEEIRENAYGCLGGKP